MNGPEHYAEAERLLALAESCDWTTPQEPYRDPAIAAAQVHATLALVAATNAQHDSLHKTVRNGAAEGTRAGAK